MNGERPQEPSRPEVRKPGAGPEAVAWNSRATAAAEVGQDIRRTIYQLRCAILVHPAPAALPMIERALELARRHGLTNEALCCQANLAVGYFELGDWSQAVCLGAACKESLRGGEQSAVLNNLGLALAASGDANGAVDLLVSALATAARRQAPAVRSNLQVVRADEKLTDMFGLLAPGSWRWCPKFYEALLFNHMRSLVDVGERARARPVARWRCVPQATGRDADLVAGRWAHLYREICEGLGEPLARDVAAVAESLDLSTKPQAWLYKARWALCPIPLDEPASSDEA
jgi:hypothetical protein